MKKLRLKQAPLLMAGIMLSMPFTLNAGTGFPQPSTGRLETKPIGPAKPIKQDCPKAPGIFDVYAWAEAGTLTVQFVRPVGVCEMTVTSASDPVGQTYTFPSEMPFSTTVDTTDLMLSLEIVTEDGITYIGDIPAE